MELRDGLPNCLLIFPKLCEEAVPPPRRGRRRASRPGGTGASGPPLPDLPQPRAAHLAASSPLSVAMEFRRAA